MQFKTDEILAFWFADDHALTPKGYLARMDLWFKVNKDFDNEVKQRFESQISIAIELHDGDLGSNPRENLARIIATDQFPRNIYRGTSRAFAYDHVALKMCRQMIDSGMHEQLGFVERVFAYMPLQHAESLEIQQLSTKMFGLLSEIADDPVFAQGAQESIEYAQLHKNIIESFGRFPHRNEILGRTSTSQEITYLESGAETFGQVKA